MATLGATFPTLVDVLKRMGPSGGIDRIAEVLTKKNPALEDFAFVEGNLPTGHRFTSRAALPGLTWRKLNQGVAPTKSRTDQVDEACGMLEAYSKVDVDVAALNGNAAAFRASEDVSFVEAFNQELNTGLFYHSVLTAPEKFHGLTPRLNATSGNPASAQIIQASGSDGGSDHTSIWLILHSPDSVFCIFPKGSKGGLSMEDLGRKLVEDSDGNEFLAYVTRWQWKIGLCVRDYRYVVRICNIDTGVWQGDLSAGPDLVSHMIDAIALEQRYLSSAVPVFYMHRDTFAMLNKQLREQEASYLQWLEKGGRLIPHFMGVPIRVEDALTKTESAVS
jgi:hypothetical protein